jgi:hypothetical protein
VNPKPGDSVVLTVVPPGLLEGLPREDQTAIVEVVGKQVLLVGYEEDGRAELEFTDKHGTIHYIFVNPIFIRLPDVTKFKAATTHYRGTASFGPATML